MDLPQVAVVVPTYWCGSLPDRGPFDHPTPLSSPSPLERLLASLAIQRGVEFLLVVLVATHPPWVSPEAEKEVGRNLAGFRGNWPVVVVGHREAAWLQRWAGSWGFPPGAVGLAGYGQVRNLQLLVPYLLGAQVTVAVDDDEVLPPEYLRRATAHVGRRLAGRPILGVGGLYQDPQGDVSLPAGAPTGNPFLDKAQLINATVARLAAGPGRLVDTPLAFGGNMVFGRELVSQVPFDPWVGRGEDIDYVLSARIRGIRFWLDKQLMVTHLPPAAYRASACAMLRRDVYRFLYERAKLNEACAHGLAGELDLEPYPGQLLGDRLELQAAALRAVCGGRRAETFVGAARRQADRRSGAYFPLQERWTVLLATGGVDRRARGFVRGLAER
ncbi:MAG: hypothetical protein ACP5G2_04310 [Candidatus Bipolaricaulaceae bacterium]